MPSVEGSAEKNRVVILDPEYAPKKEKEKSSAKKEKAVKQDTQYGDGLWKNFIAVYQDFYLKRVGVAPPMAEADFSALKKINEYLKANCQLKTYDGALKEWRFILEAFDRWDPFHQQQMKVTQIHSNLANILNSIKNGNSKVSQSASSQNRRTSILEAVAKQNAGNGI